jgi:hypothetical protein
MNQRIPTIARESSVFCNEWIKINENNRCNYITNSLITKKIKQMHLLLTEKFENENGKFSLGCQAADENLPGVIDAFLLHTDINDEVRLNHLISILEEQFKIRYAGKSNLFFHPFSFIKVVASEYNRRYPVYPPDPIFHCSRNRLDDKGNELPFLTLTGDMDVFRTRTGSILINVDVRYAESYEDADFTLDTGIQCTEHEWDIVRSKIINRSDASELNQLIDELEESAMEDVRILFEEANNKSSTNNRHQT